MTSKTPRTGNQYSIHYGDYSAVISISHPKYWSFKSIDGGHLPVGGGKPFPDGFHHIYGYAISGLLV